MTGFTFSWGACSDRGLRRAENEDAFLAEPPVFLVADGMGGHEAGAEASRRAIDGFRPLLGRSHVAPKDVERAFIDSAARVDAIPSRLSAAGTTLAGALLTEQAGSAYWLVLNIGDSRTYRFTAGRLAQISTDHSAVQQLIDRGELSTADASRHPQQNVVTRAIGGGSAESPDYWLLPVERGDRLVICSDGLTKELENDRIASLLAQEIAAQNAATRLVHEALLNGGRDNVTVVIVDAHGEPEQDDDPTRPSGSTTQLHETSQLSDDTREIPTTEPEEPDHAEL